jgi:hypothetical protein
VSVADDAVADDAVDVGVFFFFVFGLFLLTGCLFGLK